MFVIMAYDVNARRVAKVLKVSRRYLVRVQNSVFEGEITPGRLEALKHELNAIIHSDEDSVLFYVWNAGKYSSREALGAEQVSWDEINLV